MRIGILTPVRLLGEALAASLSARDARIEVELVRDLQRLRDLAAAPQPLAIVIVDTTQPIALDEIRDFHVEFPDLPLLALGLREHEAEVVAYGSAGFVCYLRREEGLDELCNRVDDALAGRLACSPEIAAGMMRALFQRGPAAVDDNLPPLTPRETHVARLVIRSLSNKEIARELGLSESTVKHHVHSILGKCSLSTRMQLMRRMRQDIWADERAAAGASGRYPRGSGDVFAPRPPREGPRAARGSP
ncbi:MAG: LuxR C-terminal-related transcriptional regulator [Caulobacterales bacterium]